MCNQNSKKGNKHAGIDYPLKTTGNLNYNGNSY